MRNFASRAKASTYMANVRNAQAKRVERADYRPMAFEVKKTTDDGCQIEMNVTAHTHTAKRKFQTAYACAAGQSCTAENTHAYTEAQHTRAP